MERSRSHDRPHWSASQLNQFLNVCSLQYFFERIAQIEPESVSAHLVFGKAVHNAIGYFYQHMKKGRPVPPEEAAGVFREDWALGTSLAAAPVAYAHGDDAETLSARGAEMVRFFVETAEVEDVVAVEQPFDVPFVAGDGEALDAPLVGYFDLVVRDGEGATMVVDIKTANKRYSQRQLDQDIQATCYCYAMSHLTSDESVRFRWDVLIKTKTPQRERYFATRSPDAFDRLVWMARTVDHAVRAEAFVPSQESYFCAGCGYRTVCREWHRHEARKAIEIGGDR